MPSPAAGQMALQFQGTELGSSVLGLEEHIPEKFPSEAVGEMNRGIRPIAKDKHVREKRQSSPMPMVKMSRRVESHWFFWILHEFNMMQLWDVLIYDTLDSCFSV